MEDNKQNIKGNNNVQVGGNFYGNVIQTNKVINRTEVIHNSEEHITPQQQYEIKALIDKLVDMLSSANKDNVPRLYSREWATFKKQFKVPSYKVLPKEDYEKAIKWLKKRTAYLGAPKQRKNNPVDWRKGRYTAINTRASKLGMSREQRLMYATEVLGLKSNLQSLKDLSDTRLNKLYNKIMSKKQK